MKLALPWHASKAVAEDPRLACAERELHMHRMRVVLPTFAVSLVVIVAGGLSAKPATAKLPPQAATANSAVKQVVGTVKSVSGRVITLATDAGVTVIASVPASAKIVRVEPGQTDLKSAVPLTFEEIQAGDRILVRGALSADGGNMAATGVIAMKHADVQAKQHQVLEDWQKRGIGGLVGAVDPAAGVVNVSVATATGARTIAIKTTKDTIIRRYAPDSVKFEDAQTGTLAQIKPGDQVRARGARNADGSELAAEEIVSGSFRNISGTVDSVDAAGGTLTVNDLVTKKPVVVRVTAQSQIRKLAPAVAQGLAQRLKGTAAGGSAGANASGNAPASAGGGPGQRAGGAGGARAGGGQADIQQALSRAPQATLTDFQKSDAVMIVSTASANSAGVTAITLVGGVEPILTSPAAQDMVLAPWSLGGGGDAGGEGQ